MVSKDIFQALSEPTRRSIIELLAEKGDLTATEIYDQFHASHPAISQHLKVLREANLVQVKKSAQQRIYQINPEAVGELGDWANQITQEWTRRLDAIDQVLEKEKRNHRKDGLRDDRSPEPDG